MFHIPIFLSCLINSHRQVHILSMKYKWSFTKRKNALQIFYGLMIVLNCSYPKAPRTVPLSRMCPIQEEADYSCPRSTWRTSPRKRGLKRREKLNSSLMKNQSILSEILSMLSNYYWEMWPYWCFQLGMVRAGQRPMWATIQTRFTWLGVLPVFVRSQN